MRRRRQNRLILITALTISVIGLTLGFAAFSNILTISSSATVSPDESDFKMTIYGATDTSNFIVNDIYANAQYCNSKTQTKPQLDNKAQALNATIDSDNLTIKNIAPTFSGAGDTAIYTFKIMNEGKYTAYLSNEDFADIFDISYQQGCTPVTGTTPEYVEKACRNILLTARATSSDYNTLNSLENYYNYLTIEPGEYIGLEIMIDYILSANVQLADGPFNIKWNDIKLNFTTVEPRM